MAKKNFTDPDDLVSSLDDLAASKPQGARSQPARTRSKAFTDEVQVDARDIALATGDKAHGWSVQAETDSYSTCTA